MRTLFPSPAPLAIFALLATAGSGFGQTFFLGIFGDQLRNSLGLTHASYGLIYSSATLCSALLLLCLGSLVDRWSLPRMATLAIVLLATGCLLLASMQHVLMLAVGFLLLRFGGQALLSHIGMVTAGRYFQRQRGRAVALTATGYPLSEAILPLLAIVLIGLLGWRYTWLAGAVFLLLAYLPLMRYLSQHAALPANVNNDANPGAIQDATRRQVLRDPGFYLLLPASLAVPFCVTALLFHQNALAALKNWPLESFAQAFLAYGIAHFAAIPVAGWLIERVGAQRLLAPALLPLVAALVFLAQAETSISVWGFLLLLGCSQGLLNPILGAIWPERYGVTHLGAIRSVMVAAMVLSTALAPLILGWLLDLQTPIQWVLLSSAGLVLGSMLLAALAPKA